MIGFMIIGGIVSNQLKSKFKKYSKTPLSSSLSGKEIAEKMLNEHNIFDVSVVSVPGKLTDHYNPKDKTVNLSPDVYNGRNISAAAVAAHECGHAVQHATAYSWLEMRSQLVPIVSLSSKMMNMIFIFGLLGAGFLKIFSFNQMIMLIILLQAAITIFSLVTLPVEYDASNRAIKWLKKSNVSNGQEIVQAEDALKWAAGTYLVSALAATTYLIYYMTLLRR